MVVLCDVCAVAPRVHHFAPVQKRNLRVQRYSTPSSATGEPYPLCLFVSRNLFRETVLSAFGTDLTVSKFVILYLLTQIGYRSGRKFRTAVTTSERARQAQSIAIVLITVYNTQSVY